MVLLWVNLLSFWVKRKTNTNTFSLYQHVINEWIFEKRGIHRIRSSEKGRGDFLKKKTIATWKYPTFWIEHALSSSSIHIFCSSHLTSSLSVTKVSNFPTKVSFHLNVYLPIPEIKMRVLYNAVNRTYILVIPLLICLESLSSRECVPSSFSSVPGSQTGNGEPKICLKCPNSRANNALYNCDHACLFECYFSPESNNICYI